VPNDFSVIRQTQHRRACNPGKIGTQRGIGKTPIPRKPCHLGRLARAQFQHSNAAWSEQFRQRLKYRAVRAQAISAASPHSLYDPQLASFSMEGYDVTSARGFIDLFGLPMKVASQVKQW